MTIDSTLIHNYLRNKSDLLSRVKEMRIITLNRQPCINEIQYSAAPRLKIIFNCVPHTVAVGPETHVTAGLADGLLYQRHGI